MNPSFSYGVSYGVPHVFLYETLSFSTSPPVKPRLRKSKCCLRLMLGMKSAHAPGRKVGMRDVQAFRSQSLTNKSSWAFPGLPGDPQVTVAFTVDHMDQIWMLKTGFNRPSKMVQLWMIPPYQDISSHSKPYQNIVKHIKPYLVGGFNSSETY